MTSNLQYSTVVIFNDNNVLKNISNKCKLCNIDKVEYCKKCVDDYISRNKKILDEFSKIKVNLSHELEKKIKERSIKVELKNKVYRNKKLNENLIEEINNLKEKIKMQKDINYYKKYELNDRKKLIELSTKNFDLKKIEYKNYYIINTNDNEQYTKNISFILCKKIQEMNKYFDIKIDYNDNCGYINNQSFPLYFEKFTLDFWDNKKDAISTLIHLVVFLKSILNIIGFKVVIKKVSLSFSELLVQIKFLYFQICNILNIKSNTYSDIKLIDTFHLFTNKVNNDCLFLENNLNKKIFIK
jgi:hypothetical protein